MRIDVETVLEHLRDYAIFRLQRGTVTVASAGVGRGATFRVRLPALPDADGLHPSDHATRDGGRPPLASHFHGVTIVAASVAEGLDAIRQHQPDLILTDLAMPGEDGFAFIRKLRYLEPMHLRRIPAVALTAYVRREDRARLLDAGYQAHLAKPFDLAELTATAAALIGTRKRS
jgi:CheY-like chemotaxis protein